MTTEDNLTLLRQKTEARLRDIAGRARGVLGFAAVDLAGGERFGCNEHCRFPQASAIKIPVLMEIYKQAAEGRFKLAEARRIEKAYQIPGGVLGELGDGTAQMSLHDLCVLMILVSDNTATNLLIDLAGMENVNRTIAALGLKETRLQRRMLDLAAGIRGEENLSTPSEAARIMEILHRGEFISRAICDEILAILKKPKPTRIGAALPPGTEVACKPGGIAGVATDWAIVLLKDRPYVLTIMENYGVKEVSAEEMTEISRVLYDYFSRLARATAHGAYLQPKNP